MNLFIRQKVFSWGDKFSVYDESGYERFFVQGEVFSFGKKLHVYYNDPSSGQREVAYIEQKLLSFLPTYRVYCMGQMFAEIRKEFTFFRQRYTVNGPGWNVEGDFFSHEFAVSGPLNSNIASVAKGWFTFGDCYEVLIPNPANEICALATVLCIDAAIESSNDD